MHLQIDFLLDEERRSGSAVRARFLVRLSAVLAPLLLVGVLLQGVVDRRAAARELADLQQAKQRLEARHREAVRLHQEAARLAEMRDALSGWADSRFDVAAMLRGLQRVAPSDLQLTQWASVDTPKPSPGAIVREGGVFLKGRVSGEQPESSVKRLADALSNEAPFSSQLERVEVRRFGAGDALADAAIRVFDIEGAFRPRRLVKAGSLRPGGQGAR